LQELKQKTNEVEIKDIDHKLEKITERLSTIMKDTIREEFIKTTERWTHNFDKMVEKTECKSCDNSEIITQIKNLKEDFYTILNKTIDVNVNNDDVFDMMGKIYNSVNKIDISNVRIDNKSLLFLLRELKISILAELRKLTKK